MQLLQLTNKMTIQKKTSEKSEADTGNRNFEKVKIDQNSWSKRVAYVPDIAMTIVNLNPRTSPTKIDQLGGTSKAVRDKFGRGLEGEKLERKLKEFRLPEG